MLNKIKQSVFKASRLIFVGDAPAGAPSESMPESMTNRESTEQIMVKEVASQTPSQIMSGVVARGSAVKTKYTNNTQILASLVGGASSSGQGSQVTSDQDDQQTN